MPVLRPLPRALLAALAGAISAVLVVGAAYNAHPTFTLNTGSDLPRLASGMYEPERHGDLTYVWTGRRALIALQGLDRRVAWTCDVRMKSGRPDDVPPPVVAFEVDGVALFHRTLTNHAEDIQVIAAPRQAPGLQLAMISAPLFRPGGDDRRELGVQLEAASCHPSRAGVLLPPQRALTKAAISAAIFGAAFGLSAMSAAPAVVAAVVVAAAQAFPIVTGPGPYSYSYLNGIPWLALWVAIAFLLLARGLEPFAGVIRGAALFAIGCTAVILYAKLAVITHPSKPVIDAVFHAHRLEYVMSGNYFFTQPIRNGVLFPYAIALYVFAWPWTALTRDYVTLLRVVVLATEALAGCMLFRMVVKGWGDRLAGALAVALFAAVPLSYVVVGNANLTNAFGQAVALIAVAAATTWTFDRRVLGTAMLSVLTALALLAHVSTLMLLLATLGLLAGFYAVLGGRPLRRAALVITVATTLAVVGSVAAYYAHFGDAYRTLIAVRSGTVSTPPTAAGDDATVDAAAAPAPSATTTPTTVSIPVRAWQAAGWTVWSIGWPLLLLGAVGAWRLAALGVRNRVGFAILSLGVTFLVFVGFTVLSPVDPAYVRYADEFIVRAVYATYPAVVILAALGAAWAIRLRGVPRALGTAMLAWAAFDGLTQWTGWLR